MIRHFGVTQKQALRTQALLRLGVTETDVRIAERLMGSRSDGADNVCGLISPASSRQCLSHLAPLHYVATFFIENSLRDLSLSSRFYFYINSACST